MEPTVIIDVTMGAIRSFIIKIVAVVVVAAAIIKVVAIIVGVINCYCYFTKTPKEAAYYCCLE